MNDPQATSDRFSLSTAFERAIFLYTENFRLLFLITLSASVIPILTCLFELSGNGLLQEAGAFLTLVSLGISILLNLTLILVIAKRSLNEEAPIYSILADAINIFWRGFGAFILFILIITLGTVLLILPGIYWMTIFSFFLFLIALENKHVLEAFRASEDLVKGRFLEVLWVQSLIFLILSALFLLTFLAFWILGFSMTWQKIVFNLLFAFLMPVWVGVFYQYFTWLKHTKPAGHIKVYKNE